MQGKYQLVYISLEVVIACLAVAGNVLVCWAVCLNSNLQSITNFFVVSLAVADIAVGLLAIPFAITISIGFCANFYGCLFIACFVLVLTQNSIFSLLAIAVDRYIAINNPLRYNSLVTGQRAKGIIALCWVLSMGIGLTPMLGWNTGWNTTAAVRCPEGMTECQFERVVTLDYMVYFNFFGCVLVPLVVMLVIYSYIFMAARRQLRLKVAHAPTPGELTLSTSSSRSTLQREVHAAKSLAIIVGLFVICWLPLHILNCFNHLCQDCDRPHIWVMNIAIILSHANSVVNPFIYAFRIREFRQTFRRIFYQHILRHRDGTGFRVRKRDGRDVGNSFMQTSSHSSKEGSLCSTVLNSYIVEPNSIQTLPGPTFETFCQWTSNLDAAPNIFNGHQKQDSTLSATQQQQQQSCIMGLTAHDGEGSHLGTTANVLEVKDSGSCIAIVNVHALSVEQTDCTRSSELAEVS
ncbi:adenosine A2a receptor b isoform X1 [Channa argus]|uniref:adenosine A2a receptor b isoform X1 n=1 Tax=Channa argus TaxID=215402 RepID=UPI0029487C36|nr:hypothetical protein Q8A73_019868 [Channa argus]